MKRLIDVDAAIDRIRGTGYADQIKENVIMILMGLPSAQTERKSKKCVWCDSPYRIEYYWIDEEGCTASFQDEERHIVATGIANFCPNCGAKMEE